MAKAKSFAVIGIGQFGRSVVEELIDLGMDVVAIDKDEAAIKKVSNILPTSYVADSSDEQALRELGIKDVEYAIVAFGSNQEASVLTTVLLKDIGVSHVIVRVDDDNYVPIMKKLGATEVITPQKAAGAALANRLGNDDYKDFYKLDEKYSVVSIVVNPGFVPKQLKDMNSKNLYGVNIVLIRRKNSSFVPGGNDSILPDDMIYVVGTNKEVKAFRESINGKQK
ncbi:MAG: TrkA family potassium uptake protein [Bacilli bacterium]|nr:TrkA family potassium uptake protein [Bacilli bacterium]MBO4682413.1 TrkA family potassium uptake protein [Bacilli bacterium]